jgi:hypothetical protein
MQRSRGGVLVGKSLLGNCFRAMLWHPIGTTIYRYNKLQNRSNFERFEMPGAKPKTVLPEIVSPVPRALPRISGDNASLLKTDLDGVLR